MKVYTVWAEWDIGQDGEVFKTKEAAHKWLEENYYMEELLEQEEVADVDALIKAGLLNIKEANLT